MAFAMVLLARVTVALAMPHREVTPGQALSVRVESLGRGLLVVSPADTVGFGLDANSLVVEGRDAVLVVDAQFSAQATDAVIAEVRKRTTKPVRWLVNTHWHDDHVSGNAAWLRAYPALTIVSARAMREDMVRDGASNRANFLKSIPGTTAYLTSLADKGTALDGTPTDSGEVRAFRAYAAVLQRFAADSALTHPTPPTRVFDVVDTIDLGARRVIVRNIGKGHTRADVIVEVPQDGVIATGDLIITPVPFIGSTSFPREYAQTIDALLARPHRLLVPGHGSVQRDDRYAIAVRELTTSIARQVDSLRRLSMPLDSVRAHVNLTQFRERFAARDRLRNELFGYYVISSAIPKAYTDGAAADSVTPPRSH